MSHSEWKCSSLDDDLGKNRMAGQEVCFAGQVGLVVPCGYEKIITNTH